MDDIWNATFFHELVQRNIVRGEYAGEVANLSFYANFCISVLIYLVFVHCPASGFGDYGAKHVTEANDKFYMKFISVNLLHQHSMLFSKVR